jgi:hypothetical protein
LSCDVQNEVCVTTFLIFQCIFKIPVKFVTVAIYGFRETYKQNTKYKCESNITKRRHPNLCFLDSPQVVTLFVVAQSCTYIMLLILIKGVITFIRTTYLYI